MVSFFLSYWNSATSWAWGIWKVDERGRVREVVGIWGFEVRVSPRLEDKAAFSRGLRVWEWGLVVLRIKG